MTIAWTILFTVATLVFVYSLFHIFFGDMT